MGGIISLPEELPESSSDEISGSIDVSVEVDSNVVVFCVAPVLFWAFFSFFDLPEDDNFIILSLSLHSEPKWG